MKSVFQTFLHFNILKDSISIYIFQAQIAISAQLSSNSLDFLFDSKISNDNLIILCYTIKESTGGFLLEDGFLSSYFDYEKLDVYQLAISFVG